MTDPDTAFSAERLQLARLRRGLNKSKLANAVGVTAPTITAWERSTRDPDAEAVMRLALALRFPESFFYAEMGDLVPLEAASFRALSRMTASQRDSALGSGTLVTELDRWLAARFHLPHPNIPEVELRHSDPAGAAAHLRSWWALGSAPIANVLQTVEAHGVRIYALATECREVDAFSFWDDRLDVPYIIVGTHKTPERQVFDIAHELGHLVLHRDHSAPRGRNEEREADQFASNFLMPREDVLVAAPRSPTFDDLARAKHRWKVSVAALAYRMHDLGLITDWHYHQLCIQLARAGKSQEVDPLPREQSRVLSQVLTALRAEGITRNSIAHDLHLHVSDLDALLNGLVVSAVSGGGETTVAARPDLRIVD